METAPPQSEAMPAEKASPTMSPFARMIAIFARPTRAWDGLENKAQWWFPLVITLLFTITFSFVLHERAILPMMQDSFEEQIANGQMTVESAASVEKMMSSPVGLLLFTLLPQVVTILVLNLVLALVLWFGVGFILGHRFRYRLALEVMFWSGLVNIPGQILFGGIAWSRQTMKDIHVGFGMLLPEPETPSKLLNGLGVLLDGLGPFSLWYVAIVIIGASQLSGAPRKSTAWALGGLYLLILGLTAALQAMFTRG